jgi:hypothetical protein
MDGWPDAILEAFQAFVSLQMQLGLQAYRNTGSSPAKLQAIGLLATLARHWRASNSQAPHLVAQSIH